MKRPLTPALLLGLAAFLLGGCASWMRRPGPVASYRPKTIALAITVNGALQPTPAQFAAIQAQAVKSFGPLGYTIVTDLSLAERIVRVDFTPSTNDPEHSGRATILGFRSNPYYATAHSTLTSAYPVSFGFAGSFSNANWYALNNFGYGYYGYENSYYDGYSYGSPTLNPTRPAPPPAKPVNPPFRHDSNQCPPDLHRVQPLGGRFATDFTPFTPNDYPRSPQHEPGRWHDRGSSWGGSTASTSYSDSGRSSDSSSGGGGSVSRNWRGERVADNSYSSSSGDRSSRSESSGGHSWWRGSDSSSSSRSDSSYSSSSSSYSSSSSSSSSYSSSSSSSSYSSSDSGSSSSYSSSSSSGGGGGGGSGSSGTHDSTANRQQN